MFHRYPSLNKFGINQDNSNILFEKNQKIDYPLNTNKIYFIGINY
jgi:hypothetical protein